MSITSAITNGITAGIVSGITGGSAQYVPNASTFDGTDSLLYSFFETDQINGIDYSGSFWIKPTNFTSSALIYTKTVNYKDVGGQVRFNLVRDTLGRISVEIEDVNNGTGYRFNSVGSMTVGVWNHVFFTISGGLEGFDGIKINGTTQSLTVTRNNLIIQDVCVKQGDATVGSGTAASLADIWITNNAMEDFEGSFAFFITGGKPRNLGSDGTATGMGQPDVWLNKVTASFNQNGGSLGSPFTISGTLVSTTGPTGYLS